MGLMVMGFRICLCLKAGTVLFLCVGLDFYNYRFVGVFMDNYNLYGYFWYF